MAYQVVARRFRPRTFAEVVGQDGVTGTLIQGLRAGRIAHAWLFAGPRGVGKTTTARILARALNCQEGPTPDPCGKCQVCVDFLAGRDMDVEEIDGASHRRIEDVRELRERVGYKPMRGSFRVFIIDEVHMLTREAFNALLKTLEEPPAHVVFILATTESHKVPETIRSRCQTLTFRRIGEEDITTRLVQICAAEETEVAPEVLREIAATVAGGMRDAESLLERVLTLSRAGGDGVTLESLRRLLGRVGHGRALAVAARVLAGDLPGLLADVAALVEAGLDEGEFLGEVVDALREVLLVKVGGADTSLLDATAEARDRVAELAAGAELQALMAMLRVGVEARARMRRIEEKRVVLELALLQMARARDLADLQTLLARLQEGDVEEAVPRPDPAPRALGEEEIQARLLQVVALVCPGLAERLGQARVRQVGAIHQVEVPGLSVMEVDRYDRQEMRRKLAAAVEEALQRPLKVRVIPAPGEKKDRDPGPDKPLSPRVERVREHFGGKVVEREQRPLFPEEGRERTEETE